MRLCVSSYFERDEDEEVEGEEDEDDEEEDDEVVSRLKIFLKISGIFEMSGFGNLGNLKVNGLGGVEVKVDNVV